MKKIFISILAAAVAFTACKTAAEADYGYEIKDGCMTDFYGNEITNNIIGCYSADGEDAELETESFFEKAIRFIRQIFNIAVEEIRKLIIDIFE